MSTMSMRRLQAGDFDDGVNRVLGQLAKQSEVLDRNAGRSDHR